MEVVEMGADNCLLFYGARFVIPPDETELCEKRHHPYQIKARELRLEDYWGYFVTSMHGEAEAYLYIGRRLSILGYEDNLTFEISDEQLRDLISEVREKLAIAGFGARLMAQWEPDI